MNYMIKNKTIAKTIGYGLLVLTLLVTYFPNVASASQLGARKVALSNSMTGATGVTYTFTFTAASATPIKSVGFRACTTATGSCVAPITGFVNSLTMPSQPTNLDAAGLDTGWTANTGTAGELRITKTTPLGAPSANITVTFSGVTNPTSLPNGTFYMRVATYSDAAWTTGLDNGTIAVSTAGLVTVAASVDETLTFTLGTQSVALGALTSATTGKGISTMSIATNASTGYSIAYMPTTTLTSGTNIIAALAGGASTLNTPQFGLNLVSNTAPSVGTNVTGAGTGAASAGYNAANSFKFNTAGDTVAQVAVPTYSNTFTTSYIANVNDVTAAGAYSTAITYVATANF